LALPPGSLSANAASGVPAGVRNFARCALLRRRSSGVDDRGEPERDREQGQGHAGVDRGQLLGDQGQVERAAQFAAGRFRQDLAEVPGLD
jgi:hypothetical protein